MLSPKQIIKPLYTNIPGKQFLRRQFPNIRIHLTHKEPTSNPKLINPVLPIPVNPIKL
jgi:hypothetical protein